MLVLSQNADDTEYVYVDGSLDYLFQTVQSSNDFYCGHKNSAMASIMHTAAQDKRTYYENSTLNIKNVPL